MERKGNRWGGREGRRAESPCSAQYF
uniref:Uncharacterized protein n=1 Tax=Anguilla anguilla TaxID=7936 RepID=A0A0E9VSU9_ANGAN